ncbi:hypothetical protein [Pseudolabrys sp. FHR47]|uniref:hypothetical protein n=1 Tax=Pseudolabrys sp. FHR47 TaxID=2562284 RepID=UPI0010BE310B|nr:hypothetical protein [Pseudolabrys sp. FHR47]
MGIIKHDFGKKKRHAVRRFRSLLGLDALHEANVRANPLPYLERASERIYQLEKTLFEAAQAAVPAGDEASSSEKILVDKAEYQRLLRCRLIIESGLKELGIGGQEAADQG